MKDLSRRERQIMDVLYEVGRATAEQIRAALEDDLSNSAVRTMLRSLERKGHVRHEQDGPRYVFIPTLDRGQAQRTALQEMLRVFFEDSPEQAVAALVDLKSRQLTDEAYDRLAKLIENARRKES